MRKIILYIAASLDGKIARKDHSLDWLPAIEDSGEDYGYEELMASVDTVLMGYKTYEVCLGLGDWHYKGKTCYVFSRSATRHTIPDVELVNEDPVAFIRGLKETEGKDIWLIGGGELIRQLHDAGLIDEYIITTIPVILGEGVELFPGVTTEQKLKVDRSISYKSGLVMTYYAKAQQ